MQARDIGLPNHLLERSLPVIVADRAVNRFIFADVEFGLIAKQCR